MNIGMGGADVSLGTIASAMGGLAVLDVNRRINTYVRDHEFDSAVTLRTQYGFGDTVQKQQLWDILNGDALLAEGGVDKADAAAQTKREGDKRVVHIAGYHDGMSAQEQFALGITLAHEAYRNGIDDGALGQQLETNRAVLGHIGFADRMAQTYGIAAIGEQMAYEVLTYYKAQSGQLDELSEVLSDYDASGDYWRLKRNGDKYQIVWDGERDLYDENGTLMQVGPTGSYAQNLAYFLGLDASVWQNNKASRKYLTSTAGVTETEQDYSDHDRLVFDPTTEQQARFIIQRDYVDNAITKYGSMTNAYNDFLRDKKSYFDLLTSVNAGKSGLISGPEEYERYQMALSYANMVSDFRMFAKDYDETVTNSDRWDSGRYQQYNNGNHAMEFEKIVNDIRNGNLTDNNYLYTAVGNGVNPLAGDFGISTKAFYDANDPGLIALGLAGDPHGQSRGGLAVDIYGIEGNNNALLYTTQYEIILSYSKSLFYDNGTGNTLVTYGNNSTQLYFHMLGGNVPMTALNGLLNSNSNNSVFRFTLPPGYNFGQVGNTGSYTTGSHLHWEIIPGYFRY